MATAMPLATATSGTRETELSLSDDPNDLPIDIALGLPGPLPDGEQILWHGKPDRAALARYLFRWPWLTGYFALFALLPIAATARAGASVAQIAFSPLLLLPVALPIAGLVLLFAWLMSRTTTYVITDRRVVFQVGVAFTRTINIPLALVTDVSSRERKRGIDIALTLRRPNKIAWLALWPHARSTKLSAPEPMLRALPPASPAAAILADAVRRAAAGAVHAPRIERSPVGISARPQHV